MGCLAGNQPVRTGLVDAALTLIFPLKHKVLLGPDVRVSLHLKTFSQFQENGQGLPLFISAQHLHQGSGRITRGLLPWHFMIIDR
jgi:hypothetical protein